MRILVEHRHWYLDLTHARDNNVKKGDRKETEKGIIDFGCAGQYGDPPWSLHPAYRAIFAAIRATSRWRSLVANTFPAQADSREDPVSLGLQNCSNPVMSRLRSSTFARCRPSSNACSNTFSESHIIICVSLSPISCSVTVLSRSRLRTRVTQSSRPSTSLRPTGRAYFLSSPSSDLSG